MLNWGYTHPSQPLGKKGEDKHAQRPFSPVTSLLSRSSGEKMSTAMFPVQLTPSSRTWCARMGGLQGEPRLLLTCPPDPHHQCTHFLQGDRQPLLSVRVSSTTDPWGISLGGNLQSKDAPPSYTCGGIQDLRTAELLLILCCPFPYFLCSLLRPLPILFFFSFFCPGGR